MISLLNRTDALYVRDGIHGETIKKPTVNERMMQENGILSTGIEAKQSNSPKEELSSEEEDNGQSEDDELDNGHNLKHQGDELSRARREKRLAMNRASAKARRKRKKVLLDSLANQVLDLTKRNQALELTNKTLRARLEQFESALAQAQATITALVAEARSPIKDQLGVVGVTSSLTSAVHQDSLRSLLMGDTPSFSNGSSIASVADAAAGSLENKLFHAQAAQLLGQQQLDQQTAAASLLDSLALRGLRYQPSLLGSLANQTSPLLGQNLMMQEGTSTPSPAIKLSNKTVAPATASSISETLKKAMR